ncbi:MAG: hypothetical protein U9O87_08525 [Verrucomicrobiota bacterium]|nr:hypothetical protein [Verrucomicrobiota bacterium]
MDPLWVFSEAYNNLILDEKAFKNPIPEIKSLKPKKNIAAYVDRKLYIHNLGHAATAYLGYNYSPKLKYIYEALEIAEIYKKVEECMNQEALVLQKEYPADLSAEDLKEHIADLLFRFKNRSLADTIFRVGRDLYRKLDRDDRLVGAMLLAQKHNCNYSSICDVFKVGLKFNAKDDSGSIFSPDKDFITKNNSADKRKFVAEVTGLSELIENEKEIIENCL